MIITSLPPTKNTLVCLSIAGPREFLRIAWILWSVVPCHSAASQPPRANAVRDVRHARASSPSFTRTQDEGDLRKSRNFVLRRRSRSIARSVWDRSSSNCKARDPMMQTCVRKHKCRLCALNQRIGGHLCNHTPLGARVRWSSTAKSASSRHAGWIDFRPKPRLEPMPQSIVVAKSCLLLPQHKSSLCQRTCFCGMGSPVLDWDNNQSRRHGATRWTLLCYSQACSCPEVRDFRASPCFPSPSNKRQRGRYTCVYVLTSNFPATQPPSITANFSDNHLCN